MSRIRITVGGTSLTGEVYDTPTGRTVLENLPIESTARTWGEEVYFSVPFTVEEEPDARAVVECGELAFWEGGQAIAIGFGPTPISQGTEIRLAAPCNIWGRCLDSARALQGARDGDTVQVTLAEEG